MELYLIKQFLDKSIEDKSIYSFYQYSENGFFCGYVLSYNSDTIQIQHYTRYGEMDGTMLIPYSDIRKITIKDDYSKGIEYLIEHQAEFINFCKSPTVTIQSNSEGFNSILKEYENDRSSMLHLETNNNDFYAFIDEVNDNYIVCTEIDGAGFEIETNIYKVEDLSLVRINNKYARKALFLYNWRKNK